MRVLLVTCMVLIGCADGGETSDVRQRQSEALADPFGYGPDVEKIAAEHAAAKDEATPAPDESEKERQHRELTEEWKRFWNP